jgi:uncharacterized surface protein with fasciclin (FAS1) repeats
MTEVLARLHRRSLMKLAAAGLGAATLGACAGAGAGGGDDIVDTAVSAGSFGTLVAALQAAGLEETLRGPGPFTVFAPTDAAFAALPAGTVDSLLRPENQEQLRSILTYHVVPGTAPASSLAGQQGQLTTVEGGTLLVDGTGDGVTVNGIAVSTADVAASNGVIHVIDGVLLP